jgi:hypothetical protein
MNLMKPPWERQIVQNPFDIPSKFFRITSLNVNEIQGNGYTKFIAHKVTI